MIYDIFYEGKNGGIFNWHEAAYDADRAAEIAADLIREGSPSVEVELRRSPDEIAAMLERRKVANA